MGKRNSFDKHLPAIAASLSILVAVLVASLLFAINSKQPQSQQARQQQKPAPAPAIGNRIKAVFDGIPASVPREHVAIIRKQLTRTTPTGKWEEIEWKAITLEPYEDIKLDMPGMNESEDASNPIAAVFAYEKRQAEAAAKGRPLPEPRSVKVQIPGGSQTTLRFRTENPFGGMSIFEVAIQQRGSDYQYKGIDSQYYRELPAD